MVSPFPSINFSSTPPLHSHSPFSFSVLSLYSVSLPCHFPPLFILFILLSSFLSPLTSFQTSSSLLPAFSLVTLSFFPSSIALSFVLDSLSPSAGLKPCDCPRPPEHRFRRVYRLSFVQFPIRSSRFPCSLYRSFLQFRHWTDFLLV